MSFSAADLVATIQLGGVSTANRDLDRFHDKLTNADAQVSKLGKTAAATFRGAATTVGVASAAAAVYVTSLIRTGVAYNQLQQTSRAALKTLVGGAEQANAQMDKLDAFARTSPFSKSVFITAQQQLIGFGMEAGKVIPTLDAMQDAVAAVGGSNQQLGDLVFILAQIQAAGKITGQDLLQFGQRGVNAAELIGSQMGKTGAQIKSEISAGTLGATEAVDALVAGMKEKFDGAAANVKGTFAGTVDRINAASRDIGAALAEPFVSKNGGGLAVDWGNQVADVMRAVEGHVAPVVSTLTSRAMPAFADLTATLDEARVQVNSWDSSRLDRALDSMADHAPALAALAGAVLGVNSQLLASIPVLGKFVPAFGPLPGAIAAAALASPQLRAELGALLGEFKPLLPVTVELATTMSGALNAALPVVAGGIRAVTAVAGPLVDMISAIPSPMLATAAAAVAVYAAMRSGAPALQGFVDGVRRIGEQAAVQRALAGMEGNTGRLAGTFGVAGKAATGLGNSLKAAFISNPVGMIILGVSTAAAILTAALSAQAEQAKLTRERVAAYKDTLVGAAADMSEATRKVAEAALETKTSFLWFESNSVGDTAKKLGLDLETVTEAMLGNADAMAVVQKALESDQAAREVASQDIANLEDTVKSYAEASEIAAREVREKARAEREAAAAMTEAERSNSRLNAALDIARDITRDATERLQALKQALDELNGGTKTQAELTRDLNEQALNLSEAFAATDENGSKLAKSLVSATGEIDTTTRAGINLHDQVSRLNDQMLDAILAEDTLAKKRGETGVSTERATEVAQPYIDKLRSIAKESGLSQEQVDGLVQTMLDTPEVVSFLITDDGSIEVQKQQLIELAQQVLATPDGSFVVEDGKSIAGIIKELEAMGFEITHLPDGKVKVTASGVSSVENALNNLARTRTAAIITKMYPGTQSVPSSSVGGGIDWPGRARGGPVFGPGTGTSDTAGLYRLSNNEHVVTAQEVSAAGGHEGMFRIRKALRDGEFAGLFPGRAEGGPIYPLRALPDTTLPVARTTAASASNVTRAPSMSDMVAAFVAALSGLPLQVRGEIGPDGIVRLIDGRLEEALPSAGQVASELPFH
ncbi:tape measure protein [Microbacterium esteraromaticum]|uniref:tape measure protein n=1 Tax=Microbacterium esteraromaticum TaxID=57043 RepID=UPI0023686B0D|nr:tape measure protein [Microbacterium esteraromaticum]WDH77935.1 tape measure protein [Microbacterium esteraromaticum]